MLFSIFLRTFLCIAAPLGVAEARRSRINTYSASGHALQSHSWHPSKFCVARYEAIAARHLGDVAPLLDWARNSPPEKVAGPGMRSKLSNRVPGELQLFALRQLASCHMPAEEERVASSVWLAVAESRASRESP